MAELAVLGCTIEITSGQEAAAIVVQSQPSSDNFVGTNGIYFGDMDVMLTGVTQGNLTCAEASLTIKGTASNILNGSDEKAVQKNDTATDTFEFTDSSSGVTSKLPVSIMVTDAGQTDVIAS